MEKADSSEAYYILRSMLAYQVSRVQLMHLHCFKGSPAVVARWLDYFPNTYFGFIKLVGSFTGEYTQAVRDLHESRLLIETDAPYFDFNKNWHSSPAVIGMVAAELAKIRGANWEDILTVCRDNALRLYRDMRPPSLE